MWVFHRWTILHKTKSLTVFWKIHIFFRGCILQWLTAFHNLNLKKYVLLDVWNLSELKLWTIFKKSLTTNDHWTDEKETLACQAQLTYFLCCLCNSVQTQRILVTEQQSQELAWSHATFSLFKFLVLDFLEYITRQWLFSASFLTYRPVVHFCRSVNSISTRRDRLRPQLYYWHPRIFTTSYGPDIHYIFTVLDTWDYRLLASWISSLFRTLGYIVWCRYVILIGSCVKDRNM